MTRYPKNAPPNSDAVNHGAERLTDLSNRHDEIVGKMRAAHAGQPGAQAYDRPLVSTSTKTAPFCFTCQTDDNELCHHEKDMVPMRSDPTGEAAMRPDPAAHALEQYGKELRTALNAINRAHQWGVVFIGHTAPSIQRKKAEAEKVKPMPACECCRRAPDPEQPKRKWYQPSDTLKPSTVNRNLQTPMLLCKWCAEFVRKHGRVPSKAESKRHAKGLNVYVVAA